MRKIRTISPEEENFRITRIPKSSLCTVKRDPIEPEPAGTILLVAFKVTGYDKDCDGSLMARLEHLELDGRESGWIVNCIGLHPDTGLVVTEEELHALVVVGSTRIA